MLAAIALGSNLFSSFGAPSANLREALHRLGTLGKVQHTSSFYETAPVGYTDQPDFLNAVALLQTTLSPVRLLHGLLETESAMGRNRGADIPLKGPRVIDLDLILFEDQRGRSLILNDPDLLLPHPAMQHRRFVLEPLAEIAPHMLHPVLHRTAQQLLDQLSAA